VSGYFTVATLYRQGMRLLLSIVLTDWSSSYGGRGGKRRNICCCRASNPIEVVSDHYRLN